MRQFLDLGANEITQGVAPALENSAVPLWQTAENAVFRDQAIRPEPGQLILFQKLLAAPVLGMGQTERAGRPVLFWGTAGKLFRGDRLASPAVVDVSDATYTARVNADNEHPATRWSIVSWGEWAVAANGVDELRAFKPTNSTFHTLGHANLFGGGYKPPAVFTAAGKAFRPHFLVRARGFILAFNHHIHASVSADNEIGEGEQSVWWPALRDAPGPIAAAHGMLDGAAAYCANTVILVQHLGAPLWFGTVRTLQGVGAFGQDAVVPVGRVHYGAGPKGLWRTDGTEFEYVDHPLVRDWFLTRLNLDQASKIVAWSDPQLGRVVWFFPTTTNDLDSAIAYDYEQKRVHIPKYIRTAASQQEVFSYPVVADADGNIWRQSFLGSVSAAPGDPISLPATYQIDFGYGGGGYGVGGYGGRMTGDG
jgi:hypothetical protein